MTSRWQVALGATLLLAGCGKKPTERERDCVEEVEAYEPTASDVPLPTDYAEVAEKRIGADNYKLELGRIAREISSTEVERSVEPAEEHDKKHEEKHED